MVQSLARRLASSDHPKRPRLLLASLTLVIVGLLAEAGIAAFGQPGPWQPVLVPLVAAELGGGYGVCLMFGLAEVARLARPGDLGGMTAVFQVASYTGFATPYLLSVLRTDASAAVLAALTLMVTAWQANRTAEHPRCRLARRILALAQQLPGLVVLLPAIRLPLSGCRTSDIGDRDGNVARPCSTAEPYPARARTVVAPADRNRTARHASQTSLITSMPRYRRRLLWRNLLTGCIAPFPQARCRC